MSSVPETGNAESGAPEKNQSKIGCGGWLGLLILLAAAATVIFFLVVKPKLEERGVDVDGSLNAFSEDVRSAGRQTADAVQERFRQFHKEASGELAGAEEKAESVAADIRSGVEQGAERAARKTEQVVQTVKEKADKGMDAAGAWY